MLSTLLKRQKLFFYFPQVKSYTYTPKYRAHALAGDGERSPPAWSPLPASIFAEPQRNTVLASRRDGWWGAGHMSLAPRNLGSTELRGQGKEASKVTAVPAVTVRALSCFPYPMGNTGLPRQLWQRKQVGPMGFTGKRGGQRSWRCTGAGSDDMPRAGPLQLSAYNLALRK